MSILALISNACCIRSSWEQQPLILNRSNFSFYQHLLSLSDVDYILSHSTIRSSDIRLVQDGQELSISNLRAAGANLSVGGLEAVFQQYRKGTTINLLFLHEHWPPLKRLCQSIAAELSVGVQVNVYLTPRMRGVKRHTTTPLTCSCSRLTERRGGGFTIRL